MKDANAAITLLEKWPEKISVGHLLPWNSYAWAEYYVHWTYRAELTHDRSHVALIAQLVEHCTGNAKVVGSNPVQSLKFFQVIFPVVLWLQSHLSFFHLIATVGHLLPWNSYAWAKYYVHWTYRAELRRQSNSIPWCNFLRTWLNIEVITDFSVK